MELSVSDGTLKSTCTAKVTVVDDEAPVVDCGNVGVVSPSEEPITVHFGSELKSNGCPVTVTAMPRGCFLCDAGKKTISECHGSIDGGDVTITDTGGANSHLIFSVTAENDSGSLSDTTTCTLCTE